MSILFPRAITFYVGNNSILGCRNHALLIPALSISPLLRHGSPWPAVVADSRRTQPEVRSCSIQRRGCRPVSCARPMRRAFLAFPSVRWKSTVPMAPARPTGKSAAASFMLSQIFRDGSRTVSVGPRRTRHPAASFRPAR
ncbi:hypothetical protein APA22_24020 [Acetobacter pasteurianus IFO 3283-22]|uniref:Uncharacterized protein n=1 Tax=Acetobacter pasteurianus (strain NBRC 105184 / IFO 3283-01) TaxID=634452 RepID=C7JFC5_ACEP3|nr:hypothetical protein APA01_24020 [Acetobacter pasteurianus IFO 3283-01]BAI03566.1 hypothetical protein APA03_24020 [Acetobacter pasteurianus IFO 3283-03]BAI06611.1 hypothetical protein APA07_24020 [Acetobacter pasteurianus IFO 3283-07]BAI09661.1 hypothetical protein APA22_24020 [Acetobacter pasteurianus IFO 3283-22]BAI12709.1 hypothetical protein APA26_24020 [Acetobacter pasteurianus IFO 3283-26]BAI15755.1 hypothetical protein APA32_24020 [Acetobacter pasteurianus IFO 3283-32]BAI18736.1 hy